MCIRDRYLGGKRISLCICRRNQGLDQDVSNGGAASSAAEGNDSDDEDEDEFAMNSNFPDFPIGVPLTYTLTMHACLSFAPSERPSFEQVLVALTSCTTACAT